MADLREADSLLQKAIQKVDERSKLDTAQVRHARGGGGLPDRGGAFGAFRVSLLDRV